jgi:hypothetical protein
MHGNEATTTKALFDFLNVLHGGSESKISLMHLLLLYSNAKP